MLGLQQIESKQDTKDYKRSNAWDTPKSRQSSENNLNLNLKT